MQTKQNFLRPLTPFFTFPWPLPLASSSPAPPQFGGGVEEMLVYVVSWVGISVAVVCLATCLTTLCCQGAPWHTDHSTIHCNLWANLLVTELLFLVGANRTQYTVSEWNPGEMGSTRRWILFFLLVDDSLGILGKKMKSPDLVGKCQMTCPFLDRLK